MGATKTTARPGSKNSMHKTRYMLVNNEKQLVAPIWHHGARVGHGNYMAGTVGGVTVEDSSGRPIPFKQIGFTE
jgi:hypothetical protein